MSDHETDPSPRDPRTGPGEEPTDVAGEKLPGQEATTATGAAGAEPPAQDAAAAPGESRAAGVEPPAQDAAAAPGAAGAAAPGQAAEAYAPPPISPRAGRDKIMMGVLVVLALAVVVFLVLIAIR